MGGASTFRGGIGNWNSDMSVGRWKIKGRKIGT